MEIPGKNYCPECGAITKRELVNDYASSTELGRPIGARGSDESYLIVVCKIHGEVIPVVDPQEEIEYQAWLDWIETLPGKFEKPWTNGQGFDSCRIDKIRYEITDEYYNYMYSLPAIVPDIRQWVAAQPYPFSE